jgi:MEMO1 family protein
MPLPALRYLDIFPITNEEKLYVCLRDPEGYAESEAIISPHAYYIAIHLDGKRGVMDVQSIFAKKFRGVILQTVDIEKIVDFLDEKGFLQTPRFDKLKNKIQDEFLNSKTRKAYLAGKSYPEQPGELKKFIDDLFTSPEGPNAQVNLTLSAQTLAKGLIVPHIDFHRGGYAYARGYYEFSCHRKPETVFIFGVAHISPPSPFVLTRKEFETPLGILKTDTQMVDELAGACDWNPYEHEIVHRTEHSIEFQAVMLSYLYGSDVKIVPILCGAFGTNKMPDDPYESKSIKKFLDKAKSLIQSHPNASVIVGADLAHVGQRFGDEFEINDEIIQKVELRDKEDLNQALTMDSKTFYQSVMKDGNEWRVCGLNCIYSALKTLEGLPLKGNLLDYAYAHDPAGGIVSFADVIFSEVESRK